MSRMKDSFYKSLDSPAEKWIAGHGEMSKSLRVPAAIAEGPSSVPITHA